MSGECKSCGTYFAGSWCRACGEGKPEKGKRSADEAAELANRQLEARRIWASDAPGSESLTDQQWFNVCKFFPKIAGRCRREPADLSPENPMHKARPGPLMRAMLGPAVERQPGEEG